MSTDANAPSGQRPYKRRTLVINKPFQYKFITIVMACVAVAFLVIAADMFSSLGNYVAATAESVDMNAVYRDSWLTLLVKAGVYMAGVFVVALMVSHKVAGPMYRFEKACETVALGDLSHRAYTRQGDEWGGFRESFNGMVDALHKKVSNDLGKVHAAKNRLEELAGDASLPAPAREKARQALEDLAAVGEKFKLG